MSVYCLYFVVGNRRIIVYSAVAYISENLFAEGHLAALCDVTDFSGKQNLDKADVQLCGYFERSQLPLILPRQLGRNRHMEVYNHEVLT